MTNDSKFADSDLLAVADDVLKDTARDDSCHPDEAKILAEAVKRLIAERRARCQDCGAPATEYGSHDMTDAEYHRCLSCETKHVESHKRKGPVCKCAQCDGLNVQCVVWWNPNTNESDTDEVFGDTPDMGQTWCYDCEDNTELVWLPCKTCVKCGTRIENADIELALGTPECCSKCAENN